MDVECGGGTKWARRTISPLRESSNPSPSFYLQMAAGNIKKGGFMVIKGRPCKVCALYNAETIRKGRRGSWRLSRGEPGGHFPSLYDRSDLYYIFL